MAMINSTSIEALNKENYDTWRMQAEALLIKNELWDYVSGAKVKPAKLADGTAESAELKHWKGLDRKAKADLILCISPSELKHIKGCETSKEVWDKLESIYASKKPARKATLLKQLALRRMVEGDDVREHINKFFNVVDELESMNLTINADLVTIMLLYSLPATFENFRCAIESRDKLPDAETLRVKIVEEHDSRMHMSSEGVSGALMAKKAYSKHEIKHSRKSIENDRNRKLIRCYRCDQIGHLASKCRVMTL